MKNFKICKLNFTWQNFDIGFENSINLQKTIMPHE